MCRRLHSPFNNAFAKANKIPQKVKANLCKPPKQNYILNPDLHTSPKTVNNMNFKQRALKKIGLDETEVSEIPPVHFEGYQFGDTNTYVKQGQDRRRGSSAYQVSWLFFRILRYICISTH